MKITVKILREDVELLNRYYEEEIKFGLDIAYGGYRLVRYLRDGGEVDISSRLTARELHECIRTALNIKNEIMWRKED